jgi:hypothetical protein
MENETVKLEIRAEPLQLMMSERKNFKIFIAATNQGDKVIDPELQRAKLFVNGKESKAWSLAIGNGKREAKWFALPPGDTVSMGWSSMGQSLFPAAGQYTLVLHFDNRKLEPIQVHVLD